MKRSLVQQTFLILFLFGLVNSCARQPIHSAEHTPAFEPRYDEGRILFGTKEAPVLIVKYVDFASPFDWTGVLLDGHDRAADFQRAIDENRSDVKVIVKNAPLAQLHPAAFTAAQIFEALQEIDKAYAKTFFAAAMAKKTAQPIQSGEEYWNLVKRLKLPADKIKARIELGMVNYQILEDYAEFSKFHLQGTPAYLVNGEYLSGAQTYDELVAAIQRHKK
jgi:protein-disulfide isomerase